MPAVTEVLAALDAAAAKRTAWAARKPTLAAKQDFYKSRAWRALRYKIISANAEKHGGVPTCEVCGARRGPGVVIHVDHIFPLSRDWSRRLDPANAQLMCESCNLGKSNLDSIDWRERDAEHR